MIVVHELVGEEAEPVARLEDGRWVEGAELMEPIFGDGPPSEQEVLESLDHARLFAEYPEGYEPEKQAAWVPYTGPRGGTGWENTATHEIRYDDEKPEPASRDPDPQPSEEAIEETGIYGATSTKPVERAADLDEGYAVEWYDPENDYVWDAEVEEVTDDAVLLRAENGAPLEVAVEDGEMEGVMRTERVTYYGDGVARADHSWLPEEGVPSREQLAAEALRTAAETETSYETGPVEGFARRALDAGADRDDVVTAVAYALGKHPMHEPGEAEAMVEKADEKGLDEADHRPPEEVLEDEDLPTTNTLGIAASKAKVRVDNVHEAPDGAVVHSDEDEGLFYYEGGEGGKASKARVYVNDPSEVPDEYELQEGPRGGLFYETRGTSGGQARFGSEPRRPEHADNPLPDGGPRVDLSGRPLVEDADKRGEESNLNAALDKLREEYDDETVKTVEKVLDSWDAAGYTEPGTAPLWAAAAELTGGGVPGDVLPIYEFFEAFGETEEPLYYTRGEELNPDADELVDAIKDFSAICRAQAKHEFGETVTVHRGFTRGVWDEYVQENEDGSVTVHPNAMESWTRKRDMARDYGYAAVTMEFPTDNVLFDSRLALVGHGHSFDELTMGGHGPYTVPADQIDRKAVTRGKMPERRDDMWDAVRQSDREEEFTRRAAEMTGVDDPHNIAEIDMRLDAGQAMRVWDEVMQKADEPEVLPVEDTDWLREAAGTEDADEKARQWVPYEGPQGGEGWQHASTGEVRYQKDPPEETEGGPSFDPDDWEEFELGDENFMSVGDYLVFEQEGERVGGRLRQFGGDEDLLGVETADGETHTVSVYDVAAYQPQGDDLSDTRRRLREHFEDAGVGQHSNALKAYTDDAQYRRFQNQLRSAREVARESPMYDHNPEMETATAILATVDEAAAETMEAIQGYAKSDLPEPMTVYRGVDVNPEQFLDRAEQAMESGEALSDPGFQSATIDPGVAGGFGNVTLEIDTDHGVYVRAASEHAGEDEILLPAGTKFEVTGVDRDTNTVEVAARGGYNLGGVDAGFIREIMESEDISYPEAVERVV